jgi:arylsulfatase A-like enzyme
LPNIVLIILDTVRGDHLSALGYARPTTPHLDRLAREGTVFEKAVAPAPWT